MDLDNCPPNTRAGLLAMNADKPLAQQTADSILSRYEAGETIEQIANDLEITPPAIYRYLARHAESEWKEYQAARALHDYQIAEDQLRTAADGVTLSRARELVRSQQWKLERVLRRIYGVDSPQVQVNINLGDTAARMRQLEQELGIAAPLPGQSSRIDDTGQS